MKTSVKLSDLFLLEQLFSNFSNKSSFSEPTVWTGYKIIIVACYYHVTSSQGGDKNNNFISVSLTYQTADLA